jgi:hypothetical protein
MSPSPLAGFPTVTAIRIPPGDWFTLEQVGAIFGMSKSWAEETYDCGLISGHSHGRIRKTRRVPRSWIVAYAANSADYALCDLTAEIARAANSLPTPTRREIAARII